MLSRLRHPRWLKRWRLKQLLQGKTRRVNLGAGQSKIDGWIATDIDTLNLTARTDWLRYFQPQTIDALLAEHVWEHLSENDGRLGARLCFEFLRPGGYLRIAVPDGFNPDPDYREHVRPGGTGPGADDHKLLYTHLSLSQTLQAAGFETRLLEYWNEAGQFNAIDWDPNTGMIQRSKRYDSRNRDGVLRYTSLIVDAIKPAARS